MKLPKTLVKERGFIGAIIGGVSGIMGGKATEAAAETAARAKDMATAENKRQFDITQEQLEPWRESGERGLAQYETMLDQYGDYEIPSNLPEAYISPKNLPELQNFESGDYFDRIQSNVPDEFSYSNEDFMSSPGRQTRLEGGLSAVQARMGNVEGLEELSQNLANREFGRSRDRAFQDYTTNIQREKDVYGRGVDEFGRSVNREAELYGRGRQDYLDKVARESELSSRDYRDYMSEVGREEEAYRRGLEKYGREYVDPLNQYAQLAGIGESTTTGLGGLRESYSQNIAQNITDAGRLRAAGQLGAANAQATAFGQAGKSLQDYWRR